EEIIVNAPPELISAGYGDLIGKLFSCLDWVLADVLGVEPLKGEVWNPMWDWASKLLNRRLDIQNRDPEAIRSLYEGLVISGLGIQLYGGSRPASGTEHLISHAWEITQTQSNVSKVLHGHQVALGSLLSCALMQEVSNLSIEEVEQSIYKTSLEDLLEKRLEQARKYLKKDKAYETIKGVILQKTPGPEHLKARREKILNSWKSIQEKWKELLPPYEKLKERLYTAGCPTAPKDLGFDAEEVRKGIVVAQLIRNRYTVLDLLAETGLLKSVMERVIEEVV
ncbi:MAG: iron-containing alcohol dehydrogenase, partial [Spirochaetales bacterium]